MINTLKRHGIISARANSTSPKVVACAMALHGGERFYSDREAKRTFGVPIMTDVRLWTDRLEYFEDVVNRARRFAVFTGERFHEFHAVSPAAVTEDASTPSPAPYRRPPPMPGRKRGRPPVSSYTPQGMMELLQRREAKRHHEATWADRAAARDADRAEKAKAREAAQAEKAAAREAARAKEAAAQAAAQAAARLGWEAGRSGRTPECAQCARSISYGHPDSDGVWYCEICWIVWNKQSSPDAPREAVRSKRLEIACAQCAQLIRDGHPSGADGVWYCASCWRVWEHILHGPW